MTALQWGGKAGNLLRRCHKGSRVASQAPAALLAKAQLGAGMVGLRQHEANGQRYLRTQQSVRCRAACLTWGHSYCLSGHRMEWLTIEAEPEHRMSVGRAVFSSANCFRKLELDPDHEEDAAAIRDDARPHYVRNLQRRRLQRRALCDHRREYGAETSIRPSRRHLTHGAVNLGSASAKRRWRHRHLPSQRSLP